MTQEHDKLSDILQDPHKYYKHPKDVLADDDFTNSEKQKILDAWEQDDRALLITESESAMISTPDHTDDTAAELREIRKLKQRDKG